MQVIPIFPTPIFVQDITLSTEEQNALISVHTTLTTSEKLINGESINDVWTNLSIDKQVIRMDELKNIRKTILINSKNLLMKLWVMMSKE